MKKFSLERQQIALQIVFCLIAIVLACLVLLLPRTSSTSYVAGTLIQRRRTFGSVGDWLTVDSVGAWTFTVHWQTLGVHLAIVLAAWTPLFVGFLLARRGLNRGLPGFPIELKQPGDDQQPSPD